MKHHKNGEPTPQSACISNVLRPGAMRRAWIGLLMAGLLLTGVHSEAAYKAVLDGISVSYSGKADAYYDPVDGTLRVNILTSGGSLAIYVGRKASAVWGDYVDIRLTADNHSLKSISIKGSPTCRPYVCGQVEYVGKFALSYGVVGNTLYYGPNYGLGMTSKYIPSSISMKYSYSTAQLFGYAYESRGKATQPAE